MKQLRWKTWYLVSHGCVIFYWKKKKRTKRIQQLKLFLAAVFFPTSLHANSDLLDLSRSAVAALIAARLVGANSWKCVRWPQGREREEVEKMKRVGGGVVEGWGGGCATAVYQPRAATLCVLSNCATGWTGGGGRNPDCSTAAQSWHWLHHRWHSFIHLFIHILDMYIKKYIYL